MDWLTYIPTITTGLIGLAGIGGAILSARMAGKSAAANLQTSIAADDKRAKMADKRQTYARYLASIIEVVITANDLYSNAEEADLNDKKALVARVDESVAALVNMLSEVQLLAPEALGRQAADIGRAVSEHAGKVQRGEESDPDLYKLRQALVLAMRVDLGEPVE